MNFIQSLFQINPLFINPQEKLFLFLGGALVLLAIVFKIAAVLAPSPMDKKVRNKFYGLFLTVGLLELLWYLFRWQNARFLGTPFVAWLLILIGLAWLVFILVGFFKSYKSEKGNWEKEQARLKYLPK